LPDKNGFESEFFSVLADLFGYLADLTLVGGCGDRRDVA
jgi:hypothetical protein